MRHRRLAAILGLGLILIAGPAAAADRGKVQAFVAVTGYDVVIESLQQGAMAGPGMVGDAPDSFGRDYARLAEEVFEPEAMKERALDILAAVMPDELIDAGAAFYASDLGQRLVAVENASHMADDAEKFAEGQRLVAEMLGEDPARLETLKAMDRAIGSEETGRRALVEIQLRFLMAAMDAGAAVTMSEAELRAQLEAQARVRAPQMQMAALIANAWTYRDIPDADLAAYVVALETPEMRRVYELLNAAQYQVMVERYQQLGARLGELEPSQDL